MKMSYGSHQRYRLKDWPDGVVWTTPVVVDSAAMTTMVVDTPEYHFGTSDKLNDLQTILSN